MRRTARGHGFLLCLLINLMFRFEWAAAALVFLGIHFWLGWPLIPVWITLSIWFLYALLITLVFSMANRAGNVVDPPKPNKNPYSKTNRDYPMQEDMVNDDI